MAKKIIILLLLVLLGCFASCLIYQMRTAKEIADTRTDAMIQTREKAEEIKDKALEERAEDDAEFDKF